MPADIQEKRETRFRRLLALTDSTLEQDFLHFLHAKGLRLPDEAQNRPDFYCRHTRNPQLPGTCIFVDGPVHGALEHHDRDVQLRTELHNRGFGVVVIRHDRPFADQVRDRPNILGQLD